MSAKSKYKTKNDQSRLKKFLNRKGEDIKKLTFEDYLKFLVSWKFLLVATTIVLIRYFLPELSNFVIDYLEPTAKYFVERRLFDLIVLFIILLVIAFTILLTLRKYRLPFIVFYLSIGSCFLHCYFRWNDNPWEYSYLSTDLGFAYLDIIFLVTFSVLIIGFFRLLYESPKYTGNDPGFALDNTENLIDKLGRKPHAESLAEKIRATVNDKSYAIGIVDVWGGGKTFFLNLIEEKIDKEEFIVIKFNPWKNQNEKSIITDFFNVLNAQLAKYDFGISSKIKKYSIALLNYNKSQFNKTIQEIIKVKLDPPVQELYDDLDKRIENLDRRILIFIDDVDRLDKNEVTEVLRLIRNTANFSKTIFLVAYDRDYVLAALDKFTNFGHEHFLEKIFQYEYTLPRYDKRILKDELIEGLCNHSGVDRDQIEIAINTIRKNGIDVVEAHLSTMRDVVRLINSFSFYFSSISSIIDVQDFFDLELLRLKYPTVHRILFEKKNQFFTTQSIGNEQKIVLKAVEGKNNESNNGDSLDTEKIKQALHNPIPVTTYLEIYLKENAAILNVRTDKMNEIILLVASVFNNAPMATINGQSIAKPSNFDFYFCLSILQKNYKDTANKDSAVTEPEDIYRKGVNFDLGLFLSNYNKNPQRHLELLIENKLELAFLEAAALMTYFDNVSQFKAVIRSLFYLAKKTPKADIMEASLNELGNKLNVEYLLESKIISAEELESFVLSLFESAEYPYLYESSVIFRILRDNLTESTKDNEEKAPKVVLGVNRINWKKLMTSYLEKYTSNKKGIDGISFEIWKKSFHQHADYVEINDQSKEIMLKLLTQDPESIAPFALDPFNDGEEFQTNADASFIYSKWEKFDTEGMHPAEVHERAVDEKIKDKRELLKIINTVEITPVLRELKEFLEKYIEKRCSPIKFKFQHLMLAAYKNQFKTTIEFEFLTGKYFDRIKSNPYLIEALKPSEYYIKLPPNVDNKFLLIDRMDRNQFEIISECFKALVNHLTEQVEEFNSVEDLKVDIKSTDNLKDSTISYQGATIIQINLIKKERNF